MQPSADKIWTTAQEHLRSMLSSDTYNLWFAPLRPCEQDQHSIVLEVANDFCEVWLKENYLSLLQDVVALSSGRHLQVRFKVASPEGTLTGVELPPLPKPKLTEAPSERSTAQPEPTFNPKNTFDTF